MWNTLHRTVCMEYQRLSNRGCVSRREVADGSQERDVARDGALEAWMGWRMDGAVIRAQELRIQEGGCCVL